jgi:hypothetical protein
MRKLKEKILRQLARSYKYQTLYARAKDLGTIRLFSNNDDLSYLQSLFLHWLEVYSSIYTDIATGEDNIDYEILEDDLRTDAYLYWKSKKKKHIPDKQDSKEVKVTPPDIPKIIFSEKGSD